MAKNPLLTRLFSKLPGVKPSAALRPKARPKKPDMNFVFFIVDWHLDAIVSDVFVEEKVRFHFSCKGKGDPNSGVLDLLGIGTDEIALVTCLEQAVGVPVLMKEIRKRIMQKNARAGIAFSVPLSAINDPALLVFKQSIHKNENVAKELGIKPGESPKAKGEGVTMANEMTHDLIISIVNQGYSDDFMNTAREAGASGGTVLNARGQAHEGAVKFFGISVQEEKEIILILSPREKKVDIMRAVCEAHGLNSKAQGIVFSLPVDNVMGLNFE